MKALIVGGAGALGSFYANQFAKRGFEVAISDINSVSAKKLCKKEGYEFVGGLNEAKKFDFVILSTPYKETPALIRKFSRKMKKGSLLVDFCSLKEEVSKAYDEVLRAEIELASIHPMHGTRLESIEGQPIVIVPIKIGKTFEKLKTFFTKLDARLVESKAKEHDEVLSIVQGLTHYSQFVSAAVLNELAVDLKRTMDFASPNYRLFISLMARVVLQNAELYSQIQVSNPSNAKVRDAFVRNAKILDELCKKNDAKGLEEKLVEFGKVFRGFESLLLESDRAVESQVQRKKELIKKLRQN